MGDIDSATGVQFSYREQTIKDWKIKEIKNWKFFLFVSIAGRYGKKKKNLIVSEHLTNSRFCTILTSQLENITTTWFKLRFLY